jgi:tellurite resistance-related uncharacterized protein/adenylate kinase family enzyme
MRIVLVGPLCSGKTTLASRLSAQLGLAHIEMDDMIWRPGWIRLDNTPEGREEFRAQCRSATSDRSWVCAGAWSAARDIVFSRADVVVSLDLGFCETLWRMVRRTVWRIWSGETVCNGNRETLLSTVFGRQSIFRYFWKQWPRQRAAAQQAQHLEELQRQAPSARVLYFTSAAQVDEWAAQAAGEACAGATRRPLAATIVQMPGDAVAYKRLPAEGAFTVDTMPRGLLSRHNTKAGVWGEIKVVRGQLQLRTLDGTLERVVLKAPEADLVGRPAHFDQSIGIVAPRQYHEVAPLTDDMQMFIRFHSIPQADGGCLHEIEKHGHGGFG